MPPKILERVAINQQQISEVEELLYSVVGLPRVAELCLRRAVFGGACGEVTVDIYNEATISLWGDARKTSPPPPWFSTALSLWGELTGGAVQYTDNGGSMFSVRAYAPSETRLVDGQGKTVAEQLVEAAQAGYAIPLDVAIAASAAGFDGINIELRVTRTRGRGISLLTVDLRAVGDAEALPRMTDPLQRWNNAAGPTSFLKDVWSDADATRFLDVFEEERPSANWRPPEPEAEAGEPS